MIDLPNLIKIQNTIQKTLCRALKIHIDSQNILCAACDITRDLRAPNSCTPFPKHMTIDAKVGIDLIHHIINFPDRTCKEYLPITTIVFEQYFNTRNLHCSEQGDSIKRKQCTFFTSCRAFKKFFPACIRGVLQNPCMYESLVSSTSPCINIPNSLQVKLSSN